MSEPFYSDVSIPVRSDLADAQQESWQRLAQPGTWWNGRERVAIAAEVRRARGCSYCKSRKAALSPYAIEGRHDCGDVLPEAAIEVIHRVTTDPQRLSRVFYEQAIEDGLTSEQYVELISCTVLTISVDAFCYSLGIALRELPEPLPGEPTRLKADGTFSDGAFVPLLAKPRGRDADLYSEVKTPIVPNVIRALSSVPDELPDLIKVAQAEYLKLDKVSDFTAHRSLDRQQTELIATRVSALNECFY